MQCEAIKANGARCRADAVTDQTLCTFHRGEHIGAPTKLTPELVDKLVSYLRSGNYVKVACRAVGISPQLLSQWLDRGVSERPEDAAYADLRERVQLARSESEARNVAIIATAARESWQAAAWLLERQYPDRWGRPSVRMRDDITPEAAALPEPDDVFTEVDELAAARRKRIGA